MKSYKQWKLVNEAVFPSMNLGLVQPQTIGGVRSNLPGISDLNEKKKMNGKVVVDEPEDVDVEDGDDDHGCSCKDKKSKKGDEIAFSKKNMKKKMKKNMGDDLDLSDDSLESDDDDDINSVETPDDDGDDHGDDDHDDDHDDEGGDDDDHGDDDHDDDHDDEGGEDDAPKFGFMKDKKKGNKSKEKEKKKKKVDEQTFWQDINSYRVAKNVNISEDDFFNSLARQYGNPKDERFSSGVQGDGVNEDLLLTPDQMALISSMPKPGEVGYAQQRLGGEFGSSEVPELASLPYGESYEESVEESSDYEVLCKYLNEDIARSLIEKKRSQE
jgi:hypothetical protein